MTRTPKKARPTKTRTARKLRTRARSSTLVIDANSLIARSIYASALGDLQAGGVFTGGIYGSLVSLRSMLGTLELQGIRVGRIIACFDNGVPPRRMRLLPDYKAARRARRELLSEEDKEKAFAQIGRCYDLWPSLGVLCLSYRRREADDVVAAVVQEDLAAGGRPVVVSSDRDLWQTVAWGASVFDLRVNELIDADSFEQATEGVSLGVWCLYKALVGDASDGIKGVNGCGPKRALGLLRRIDFSKCGDSPAEQFEHVCACLRREEKLMAFESAMLSSVDHIRNVIEAIDLRESFGPRTKLRNRICELPSVDRRAFLRQCRDLSFASIMADPDGTLGPFLQAESAR